MKSLLKMVLEMAQTAGASWAMTFWSYDEDGCLCMCTVGVFLAEMKKKVGEDISRCVTVV